MDAVMGALHHLKWGPLMNKNSDLMSTAPLPNYGAATRQDETRKTETAARCEPPGGTADRTYHVLKLGKKTWVLTWWAAQRIWHTGAGVTLDPDGLSKSGWRYSHPVDMNPPAPDPHAALKKAVIEAASEARAAWFKAEATFGAEEHAHRQVYWKARDAIFAAADALAAAQAPPDPAKELREAMAGVSMIGPSDAAARLEAAIDGAIAALRKGGAA
jgi:hypothetical protein